MKKSWFYHNNLSTSQADKLLERYATRNIRAEKSLELDPRLWFVRAFLPETKHSPRIDRRYQQRIWG